MPKSKLRTVPLRPVGKSPSVGDRLLSVSINFTSLVKIFLFPHPRWHKNSPKKKDACQKAR
jgi:hypothetical protein